ncbi:MULTISPECIES: glycosyltransferase [Bacillaceae]|uniref:glycosyltransferase n=1 Tax=Bacillaceae TaxID=186817 RepID=UPI001C566A6F|nr:glycosyltransferase [Rossellomorea sp. YZS02]MBW3113780.1 glycosyltransferase [Bacillus sp. MCCB 382]MDX8343977.1 glycosyltransferase [Rossellomorea sp. YZS02]
MQKKTILIISADYKQRPFPDFHYLMDELEKGANIILWQKSSDINEILFNIDKEPDFILINDYGEKFTPKITNLRSSSIPKGVIVHDLHYEKSNRKRMFLQDEIDYIFSYYRDAFIQFYPEFANKLIWLPHHVNTELFKDYGLSKSINKLLMGSVSPSIYPLRAKILQTMKNKKDFVYHAHPGYRKFSKQEMQKLFIYENYAKEINRAKMFFTCDSIYKYPVSKYYQVLACRTLLLAPSSPELKDLGFIAGKHFVEINSTNFVEVSNYYSKNEKECERIAENGYKMVRLNHTTKIRAAQLLKSIHSILETESI